MSKQTIAIAANDANDALALAKRILLENRVQQFTGHDVVKLTEIIINREEKLTEKSGAKTHGN